MATKTSQEIIQDLINQISIIQTNADTSTGFVLRDLVIDVVASQIAGLYTEIDTLRQLSSLVYADTMSETDLDNLAFNWDLTRRSATVSAGVVTFRSISQPATTIPIPLGTIVRTVTENGISYSFETTEEVTLSSSTIFNSSTGYYEVDADIQSSNSGAAYNISANTITIIGTPINGVDYVVNKLPTTGGTDRETNTALATRILAKVQGIEVATANGYRSLALTINGVQDALAVGPNDSEMVRNIYGGSVDLYLMGQVTDTLAYATVFSGLTNITLFQTKPVTDVGSVIGITLSGGNNYNFVEDTDYEVHIDTSPVFGFSTRAYDYIEWLPGGLEPFAGSTVTIAEVFDKTVVDVQELLDDSENKVITADVLAKTGTQIDVVISLVVNKLSGFVSSDIQTNVINTITNNIAALGLGQRLHASDVVGWVEGVTGVDSVNLPFTLFYRDDQAASNSLADIIPTKLQFLRASSITVTVI